MIGGKTRTNRGGRKNRVRRGGRKTSRGGMSIGNLFNPTALALLALNMTTRKSLPKHKPRSKKRKGNRKKR